MIDILTKLTLSFGGVGNDDMGGLSMGTIIWFLTKAFLTIDIFMIIIIGGIILRINHN